MSALELAGRIRRREIAAVEVTAAAIARAESVNPAVNAFTAITAARARAEAAAVDAALARGEDPGPLAGVPFAAKNLFDIEGIATLAGSLIERRRAPAQRDAFCLRPWPPAGAGCIGARSKVGNVNC
jgi:Asp-tRNA(Asn)/Glu-tRNA(Gln) amidotransferase A subunit family amidase